MTDADDGSGILDTTKPHPARMYDYYLNGKDHYPVDAAAAQQVLSFYPQGRLAAQANRRFMNRAVRLLAQHGVKQFLDIGTGIPTEPNLHQIAQGIVPGARVVYVDNDPIVLRHAEALLSSGPEGRTEYVQADVRSPDVILRGARNVLDFDEPIALSLVALLHFVSDEHDPRGLVRSLLDPLPSGSHLVLSHGTADLDPEAMERVMEVYRNNGVMAQLRSEAEVATFFDGLELLEPGLRLVDDWHPEAASTAAGGTPLYVGVGRKV
ncbi:SAM-dependent methyltransferase [Streptomyces albipurpureus]|uniref:SAM-dependent methyltransferase n=1 Tax=Streptomyces albipurpureus TaxID=2897419 RepID=A0ABT0UNI9_9ACTN|nr:SAM-dependent methyltransferase [Streptomyces sp. CWNU-1]MCM2389796.1 SAM-dependent methyltransferase [Streptomyces sp. CWNU-1]